MSDRETERVCRIICQERKEETWERNQAFSFVPVHFTVILEGICLHLQTSINPSMKSQPVTSCWAPPLPVSTAPQHCLPGTRLPAHKPVGNKLDPNHSTRLRVRQMSRPYIEGGRGFVESLAIPTHTDTELHPYVKTDIKINQ